MITGICTVCGKTIQWVECITGGWWEHAVHLTNNHAAVSEFHPRQVMDELGWWSTVDDSREAGHLAE